MNADPRLIRSAAPADVETIAAFNAAMALETEAKTLDAPTVHAGVRALLEHPQRGFYLVAECPAGIVGCVLVTFEWSDWRNGNWWWLQSVYVAPSHRRRGIYRALHAEVERRAAAAPDVLGLRLYVDAGNARATQTYRAAGMHEESYRIYRKDLRPGMHA